jgi:hypothetical protein
MFVSACSVYRSVVAEISHCMELYIFESCGSKKIALAVKKDLNGVGAF